jgi:transposase InsO family protein
MRYRFIDEHRAIWPLVAMAKALDVSRQGYHAWKHRLPAQRTVRMRERARQIQRVYDESNGSYGSPRVTLVLRKAGDVVSEKTVAGIMRRQGLRATAKRRYRPCTDSSKTLAPAPNRFQRSFRVSTPDKVWVSDFTELPCRNGKTYAVAIMDLCSRRILGCVVSHSMQTRTLLAALEQACRVRKALPEQPLIFHSDRGSQYNAETFRRQLAIRNIEQSMSGVGNCYDNAPMESFWARMKTELRHEMLFDDLRHARTAVYRWVHLFYNRKRLHSGIGNLTPIEFEERLSSLTNDRTHCQ